MDNTVEGLLGLGGVVWLIIAGVLFFVAIIWILFPFLMMSRIKEVKEAIEKGNIHTMGLSHEAARTNELLTAIAASLKESGQSGRNDDVATPCFFGYSGDCQHSSAGQWHATAAQCTIRLRNRGRSAG